MNEQTDDPLLPLSNERMRYLIQSAITMMGRSKLGVPLWSIVGSLTSHGSGYSYQICRELRLDPNQIVKSPRQNIL
jgi:hypothetical protein